MQAVAARIPAQRQRPAQVQPPTPLFDAQGLRDGLDTWMMDSLMMKKSFRQAATFELHKCVVGTKDRVRGGYAQPPKTVLIGMSRVGVVLLNLGGPERIQDVGPFLYNLFADPEIIRLPSPA
ncbi:MAG: ferrochelatase, partial [Synechococcus sp.]